MTDETQHEMPIIRRRSEADERGVGLGRILRSYVEHRRLVSALAWRELTDMHAGEGAGALWIVVHPVVLMIVYAFLFTVALKVRIGDKSSGDYVVYLFAGLAPWFLTQDVMARSCSVMLSNISIVKKVMFPLDVLVAKTILASLIAQSILLIVVCAVALFVKAHIPWTFALLPILAIIHITLLIGLGLFFSAISPYFRDTPELVRIFLTVNMYFMPVMYLPNWIPEKLQFILTANPFSHLIWCYQDAIYFEAIVHPWSWLITALFATFTLLAGSAVFLRLRHHIPSVL